MKRWMWVVLAVVVLIASVVGCLAFQLYAMYTTYQVEEMIASARGTVVVDSTLLAEATTEVDYEAIARVILLEQQVEYRDLILYDGMWRSATYDEDDSTPTDISFDYYFKYRRFHMDARITIYPSEGRASWSLGRIGGVRHEIDLSSRRVHIPQALQIVSTNGGRDFCEAEENGCEVWGHFGGPYYGLEVESSADDWFISYRGRQSTLRALVDSQTGEYNIWTEQK